jgi:hypothetical protein
LTSTSTDGDGLYSFSGVADGIYVICQLPQEGWWQSEPTEGATCPSGLIGHVADVASGSTVSDRNFGNVQAQ